MTHATGAQLIEVPTLNDGFDLERILEAVDSNTRVVYIANPNNPTGTILDARAIDRFLDRLPSHVISVLDEAYCDYASYFAAQRGLDYSHWLDYVRANARWLCCEPSRRRTAWRVCESAMGWVRRS